MSEWQPITTAPRDGTNILLAHGNDITSGKWARPNGFNPLVTMLAGDEGGYWCHTGSAFPFKPTHWMPLPSPPVTP